MDSNAFTDLIRGFFAGIVKFLYKFFSGAIDLMYDLAAIDFGFDGYIDKIADKIFNILIIFMLFKVTFSILNYIVNPDIVTDNSKGIQNIIKRIVIVIVMLISINPIFEFLTTLQKDIIDSEVIASILGSADENNVLELKNSDGDVQYAYGVRMNSNCSDDKYVYTFSKGDHMALLLLKPFIQPYSADEITTEKYQSAIEEMNNSGYCGISESDFKSQQWYNVAIGENTKEGFRQGVPGPNSAEGFMYKKYYAGEETTGNNTYIYDFNYFFALAAGLVGLLIIINYCFDIVIRSCTLVLLKLIAPIPIISYVSPQGKSSEMMGTWLKKIGSVWISLFIRIAVLSIAISLIGQACEVLSKSDNSSLIEILVILGILMFAKKLPSLLEELIPGLKLNGGFEFNPLKRISKDALGGNYALGAAAWAGGSALAGTTNFAHRTGQFFKNRGWRGENGGFSLRNTLSGLGTIAGSTIAGATRGGVNAFGRTAKDGKMFGGMWNGYQTAMYSKLIREENKRKGTTFFGTIAADLHRMTGTLTAGQQEQIDAELMDHEVHRREQEISNNRRQLDLRKRELAQEKYSTLQPIQSYNSLAKAINGIVDKDDQIAMYNAQIDVANENGDFVEAERLRQARTARRNVVSRNILTEGHADFNPEAADALHRMQQLVRDNDALQQLGPILNNEGSFNRGVERASSSQVNIISRTFDDRERSFEVEERQIAELQQQLDEYKNTPEFERAHDKDSPAKNENSIQINNKVQQPGNMFSAGRPAQQTIDDQSFTSNIGGNN